MSDIIASSPALQRQNCDISGQFACLRTDVVHVLGAHRSAVYDLRKERIYWLDRAARNALQRLTCGTELSAAMGDAECRETFNLLQSKGLLVIESTPRNEQLSEGRPATRAPALAWLELGTLCNHRCFHCYNESGPASTKQRSIELENLLRAVDEIARCAVPALKLIGGEPLVHFELALALLERARERGIRHLSIHSNGTLLTRERARKLAELQVGIDITVYGHTAALHDEVTQTPGSYERTLGGVRNALTAELAVTLNLIVVPSNEAFVDEISGWFREQYPAASFGYDYTRPVGRGRALYEQMTLKHLNRYQEHDIGFDGVNLDTYRMRKTANPCLHDKLMITADGEVSPCIMQRNTCGSIHESSLSEILTGEAFSALADLSLDGVDVCRDCEFRYACNDCRPIAEGMTGNRRAKPPECTYNPYTGQTADKERTNG